MVNDQTSSLGINSLPFLPLLPLKIKISHSHCFEDSIEKNNNITMMKEQTLKFSFLQIEFL